MSSQVIFKTHYKDYNEFENKIKNPICVPTLYKNDAIPNYLNDSKMLYRWKFIYAILLNKYGNYQLTNTAAETDLLLQNALLDLLPNLYLKTLKLRNEFDDLVTAESLLSTQQTTYRSNIKTPGGTLVDSETESVYTDLPTENTNITNQTKTKVKSAFNITEIKDVLNHLQKLDAVKVSGLINAFLNDYKLAKLFYKGDAVEKPFTFDTFKDWIQKLIIDKTIQIQGIQGLKGDTGAQGIQGLKGDTGAQGIQGLKGDTGAQGIQGLKGDTGVQGIQGLKGADGKGYIHLREGVDFYYFYKQNPPADPNKNLLDLIRIYTNNGKLAEQFLIELKIRSINGFEIENHKKWIIYALVTEQPLAAKVIMHGFWEKQDKNFIPTTQNFSQQTDFGTICLALFPNPISPVVAADLAGVYAYFNVNNTSTNILKKISSLEENRDNILASGVSYFFYEENSIKKVKVSGDLKNWISNITSQGYTPSYSLPKWDDYNLNFNATVISKISNQRTIKLFKKLDKFILKYHIDLKSTTGWTALRFQFRDSAYNILKNSSFGFSNILVGGALGVGKQVVGEKNYVSALPNGKDDMPNAVFNCWHSPYLNGEIVFNFHSSKIFYSGRGMVSNQTDINLLLFEGSIEYADPQINRQFELEKIIIYQIKGHNTATSQIELDFKAYGAQIKNAEVEIYENPRNNQLESKSVVL